MKLFQLLIYSMILLYTLVGCGTRTGSGVVSTGANGSVTIRSSSFSTSGFIRNISITNLSSSTVAVSTLQICLAEMRMVAADGSLISNTAEDHIDFTPGLIDLSSGNQVTWATLTVPVNFSLKKVRIKIRKNESLCGGSFSVKFNSTSTEEEVELEFVQATPTQLSANSILQLSLSSLVNSLKTAGAQPGFNSESLKQTLENVEESLEEIDG